MLDRVIAEFETKLESEQVKAAWRVQEQRILDDLAFPLWLKCRECIESACKKHSKHLSFEVQPDTDVVVRSKTTRQVLSVEYFPNSYSFTYKIGRTGRRYFIRIDDDRQAVIWDQDRDVFRTPEDIADELLTLIFTSNVS